MRLSRGHRNVRLNYHAGQTLMQVIAYQLYPAATLKVVGIVIETVFAVGFLGSNSSAIGGGVPPSAIGVPPTMSTCGWVGMKQPSGACVLLYVEEVLVRIESSKFKNLTSKHTAQPVPGPCSTLLYQ
jgi:hypothetical protein